MKRPYLIFGLLLVAGATLAFSTGSVNNVVQFSDWLLKDVEIRGKRVFINLSLLFKNDFPFTIPSNAIQAEVLLRQKVLQNINFSLPNIPPNSTIDQDLTIEVTTQKLLALLGLSVLALFNRNLLKRELKLKGTLSSNGLTIPFERSLV